jgi:hypothetical protein
LIDEIGFAVVRVPPWSLEGGDEAVTMEHMMSRGRFGDFECGGVAPH